MDQTFHDPGEMLKSRGRKSRDPRLLGVSQQRANQRGRNTDVGVNAKNPFGGGTCMLQSDMEPPRFPCPARVNRAGVDQAYARVARAVALDNGRGFICRPAVYGQDFCELGRLGDEGIQASSNSRCLIENRQDNADPIRLRSIRNLDGLTPCGPEKTQYDTDGEQGLQSAEHPQHHAGHRYGS